MILVDTNVWIEHFRKTSTELVGHLMAGHVLMHEFILGELSLAHFKEKERKRIFERLHALERIETSSHEEVYEFARSRKLAGKGVGWIDSHLLYACQQQNIQLLTLDRNLARLANKILKA